MSATPPPATVEKNEEAQEEIQEEVGQEEVPETDAYQNIFGAEDDEDEDDDVNGDQPGRRAFPTRLGDEDEEEGEGDEEEAAQAMDEDQEQELEGEAQEGEGGDEDVEMGDEENETYVPATATSSAKIPKFKKSKRASDDEEGEGEEGDGEERRRKKKKRSEKRKEGEGEEDEEAPVYDAETQRRLALEERIDSIGKKPKAVRRKKKGDDQVDIVDSYHDDVCSRLRDRMLKAADKDEEANKNKMPGTAKLAMLDEVMAVLRNTTLWQSIVDNGVLEAVKRWLEPLPDRSLPSVGIQKAIFEVLPKMDLDTTTLKECRLGPIVLFYTKTKRVTPAINRQADALVQAWSRPIIKRPANFRSKHIESQGDVEAGGSGGAGAGSQVASQGLGGDGEGRRRRFDVKAALEENANRKGARLQIVKDIQYTVAPESRTQHLAEEMQHVSRIQTDNRKFNKFARQMMKTKGGR
ncbi:hypothetical protein IAT38_007749 [Cryptococcus sp. DSM 104549]